jgi:hypothetical protein
VPLSGGAEALVVVRRNVDAKYKWFRWDLDRNFESQHLSRLIRRDRSWRVELYYGLPSRRPVALPREDAICHWVAPNRRAAFELAQRVLQRVRDVGVAAQDDDFD